VHNAGTTHRVHLVIDLIGNAALTALLEQAESLGQGRLTDYFLGAALAARPKSETR